MSNREQSTYAQRLAAAIARDVERATPIASLRSLAEGCDAAAGHARFAREVAAEREASPLNAARYELAKAVEIAASEEACLVRGRLIAAVERARVTA